MLGTVPEGKYDSQEKKGWQLEKAYCHILLINSAIWRRMKSQTYALTGKRLWVEQGVRPVGKHMVQSTLFALPPVFRTEFGICNMNRDIRRALDVRKLPFHYMASQNLTQRDWKGLKETPCRVHICILYHHFRNIACGGFIFCVFYRFLIRMCESGRIIKVVGWVL